MNTPLRLCSLVGLFALLIGPSAMAQARLSAPALYPNPVAGGPVTVAYAEESGAGTPTVEVFDLLGRRVAAAGTLPAGVYLVRLRWPDGRASAPQRLTRLASGPFEVRLRPTTAPPAPDASTPPAGSAARADDETAQRPGCMGPTVWEALLHAPLGVAQVGLGVAGNLVVSNIGSSGQDGVRTCLSNAAGAGVFIDVDLNQPDMSFVWDLDNDGIEGNGVLSRIVFDDGTGPHVNATVDLTGLGATSLRLDVWEHGVVVHTEMIQGGIATFALEEIGGGGITLTEASTYAVPQIEGELDVASAAGSTGTGFQNGLLNLPTEELFGNYNFVTNIVFDTATKRVIGDRVVVSFVTGETPAVAFRESRMRFANTGPVVLEDASIMAMGHFHSAPDTLDTTRFLLSTASPNGRLAVRCPPSGCPSGAGVQIWVPQGSPVQEREQLQAVLRPVSVPSGGNSFFDIFTDLSLTEAPRHRVRVEGAPGGVILRMDKENCDEAWGGPECEATFEYRRDGQVVIQQTVQAGEPVFLPTSIGLLIRSGLVNVEALPEAALRTSASWEIGLGVSLQGGQETMRFYGVYPSGPTAPTLAGMTLLSNRPFSILAEMSTPAAPVSALSVVAE